MSFDKPKGTNTELGETPALITPVELESAYLDVTQQTKPFIGAARRLTRLVANVHSSTSLSTIEKTMIQRDAPALLRVANVCLESMAHAVSDPAARSGPKQGNPLDSMIQDIELHLNGYTGKSLPETELGKQIEAAAEQSTDRMFNQESSEADGIAFGATPETFTDPAVEQGLKTGVKILLGEDGLKIDFESSAANILHSVNKHRTRYATTVASVLSQCRAGNCPCRIPEVTYVGSTTDELKERLKAAIEIAGMFNNSKISEPFLSLTKRSFELAASIQGKEATDQQQAIIADLENAIETVVTAFKYRLPYVNTTFIFNGEVDEYGVSESVGKSVAELDADSVADVNALAVAVMSISYEDILNSYYREYKALVKQHGFDLVNVDAELRPGVECIGFIFYRFVREVVCGLIEHMFDLKGMLKESV